MRVSYYSDDQIDFWIDVLEKIKFTITNSPFNYIPEYIGELLEYFKENEERSGYWKLVALCNSFSGLLTTKYVNFANKEKAKCRLEDEIANAISECPEDYGDYEQCESWHQGYDYLLDEGNKFKEVFPKDELEGFEDFYNLAEECPYEPEPDYEPFDSYENEDFNIQEIFRDL
jgi:hypothetical protein